LGKLGPGPELKTRLNFFKKCGEVVGWICDGILFH